MLVIMLRRMGKSSLFWCQVGVNRVSGLLPFLGAATAAPLVVAAAGWAGLAGLAVVAVVAVVAAVAVAEAPVATADAAVESTEGMELGRIPALGAEVAGSASSSSTTTSVALAAAAPAAAGLGKRTCSGLFGGGGDLPGEGFFSASLELVVVASSGLVSGTSAMVMRVWGDILFVLYWFFWGDGDGWGGGLFKKK
jgi:hypothetical protein